jgi:predicted permease
MSWLRAIASGVRYLFGKGHEERELREELDGFLEMAVEEKSKQGMSREESLRTVRLEQGTLDAARETVHAARWESFVETCWHDLRFALRMLRKSPAFTTVAVLTLALGIGANTAMFSVIDTVLLSPLPFPEPDRLVDIYANWPQFSNAPVSYPNFLDLQHENRSFQVVADWRIDWFTLTGSGEPERLAGEMVSADFLSVLGVQPLVGRSFHTEDDLPGAAPVAMLGEGLWKRRFGSDASIIGQTITLNGKNHVVIGIVPSSVRLLQIRDSSLDDVFVPVGQWDNALLRDRRFSMGLRTVGRLKPNVTLEQARVDMHRLQGNLTAAYPNVNAGLSLTLGRLKDDQVGDVQSTLLMLWGAVGLVLLIACANVANLLLARANGRRQELAIRATLGASHNRIVRQLLIESGLLVIVGGAVGVVLAKGGTRTVLAILPSVLPATSRVEMNSRVLVFAAMISLVAAILFGLAPALRLSKSTLREKLQESHHRIAGSHRGMQAVFVAAEIGLALVLLTGAGLLIRSLEKVWAVKLGFDPAGILTCKVSFAPGNISNSVKAIETIRELTTKVSSIPGASSVGIALGGLPFELDSEAPIWPDEKPKPEKLSGWPLAVSYIVGPSYFDTMRIPLVRGRAFAEQDNESARPVAVIDENLANDMFAGEDPVGKALDVGAGTKPVEIVGVVRHVAQWGFDERAHNLVRFQVYSPSLQVSGPVLPLVGNATTLIVRTDRSPTSLVEPIRQTVRSLDGSAVLYDVRTMHDAIAGSLAQRQFSMTLLSMFAGLALLLAVIGIYGVVSYLVGQRTNEIGIRMALGAEPRDVLRDVLAEGGKMALTGVASGLAASFALTRLMTSMLFGVSVTDPLTYAGVVIILLAMAMFACWIPARRAMRVDPMVALRYE